MRFGIEGETGFGDGGVSPLDRVTHAHVQGTPENRIVIGRMPAYQERRLPDFGVLGRPEIEFVDERTILPTVPRPEIE